MALRSTEHPIDIATAAGKAFLDMVGVFAEFETNLHRERRMEGIQAVKAQGIYKGRRPEIDPADMRGLHNDVKLGPSKTAKQLKISRASVHRLLGEAAPLSASFAAVPSHEEQERA